MPVCNTTLEDAYIVEQPLWEHGLTFHRLFLIISAAFGLISVVISLYLICSHATHYSKPWEQKHIIRILFMIPVYSTVSFLSFLNYRHSIYYQVLRDCYEAFAIASFFTLLCNYIAPNLHDQKDYFRALKPINWFWGVFGLQKCTGGKDKGPLRIPRSGLTWFNVIYVSVFQYCFIRVLFTIVSVASQAIGRYCDSSLHPAFAHVWVMVFEAAAVTIAMFCLVQFYLQLRVELAMHKPFLKVLCIKLVIFFSFWQTFVISFLSSSNGPLHPSSTIAYSDIKIGIPSMLLCVEMAVFAIMHLFAFPWKPYTLEHLNTAFKAEPFAPDGFTSPPGEPGTQFVYHGGSLGLKALADAFNPWDIIKASARGFRWLFVGRRVRFQDTSYSSNMVAGANKTTGQTTTGPEGTASELGPFYSKVSNMDGQGSKVGSSSGNLESDMDGLLAHPDGDSPTSATHPSRNSYQANSSPFQTPYQGSGAIPPLHQGDLSQPNPYQAYNSNHPSGNAASQVSMPNPGAYGGHNDAHGAGHYYQGQPGNEVDTSYHGSAGPAAGPGIGMAYSGPNNEWAQQNRPHDPRQGYGGNRY